MTIQSPSSATYCHWSQTAEEDSAHCWGEDVFEPQMPAAPLIPARVAAPARSRVLPLEAPPQPHRNACGQSAVAATLSFLTGKKWTATGVARRYGYHLFAALQRETRGLGLHWKDRDFTPRLWAVMEAKVRRGRPVLMGLNGPTFSPSGRGHIVALVGFHGDLVHYWDPACGKIRCLPKSEFERASGHPQGKFVWFACK